jgi:hypothetical protein
MREREGEGVGWIKSRRDNFKEKSVRERDWS